MGVFSGNKTVLSDRVTYASNAQVFIVMHEALKGAESGARPSVEKGDLAPLKIIAY